MTDAGSLCEDCHAMELDGIGRALERLSYANDIPHPTSKARDAKGEVWSCFCCYARWEKLVNPHARRRVVWQRVGFLNRPDN